MRMRSSVEKERETTETKSRGIKNPKKRHDYHDEAGAQSRVRWPQTHDASLLFFQTGMLLHVVLASNLVSFAFPTGFSPRTPVLPHLSFFRRSPPELLRKNPKFPCSPGGSLAPGEQDNLGSRVLLLTPTELAREGE